MTATVALVETTGQRVARVPLSALFNQGTGPAVYVVDDKTGAVRLQSVTINAYEARDVLVTGGVADGDKVVALGAQKLDPAQKVRIVDALAF
jgi:multidrug efflux pump subunit AcrA (membrane-fusion protein)